MSEEDVVAQETPLPETDAPVAANDDGAISVEDAQAMFDERADLSAVLTTEGWLNRDGTFA